MIIYLFFVITYILYALIQDFKKDVQRRKRHEEWEEKRGPRSVNSDDWSRRQPPRRSV